MRIGDQGLEMGLGIRVTMGLILIVIIGDVLWRIWERIGSKDIRLDGVDISTRRVRELQGKMSCQSLMWLGSRAGPTRT